MTEHHQPHRGTGRVPEKEVQQATPPAPEHAIEGVKEDIAVVKGGGHS